MGLYEKVVEELQKITVYHWIRIGICGLFTYLTIDYLLTRIIIVESTRFMLDVYHLGRLFNETNTSQANTDLVIGVFGDQYIPMMVFYFIIIFVINMVIWKWFALPTKLFKKSFKHR